MADMQPAHVSRLKSVADESILLIVCTYSSAKTADAIFHDGSRRRTTPGTTEKNALKNSHPAVNLEKGRPGRISTNPSTVFCLDGGISMV